MTIVIVQLCLLFLWLIFYVIFGAITILIGYLAITFIAFTLLIYLKDFLKDKFKK